MEEKKESKERLPEEGYYDLIEWSKFETPDGRTVKCPSFPVTRYPNILNRPRVIDENSTMALTPNANFHLLTTSVGELSDDIIYEMFGQTW